MNFFKLSIYYKYLYSPKSFFHRYKSQYKIYYIIFQLLILPYISLINMLIILIGLFIVLTFIYLPKKKYYFLQIISTLGLIIFYIHLQCVTHIKFDSSNLATLLVQHMSFFNFTIYISLPMYRLLSINFIYFLMINLFLLTTHYEEIVLILFSNNKYFYKLLSSEISFMIIISLQLIQTIFVQIKKTQKAIYIRGSNNNSLTKILNFYNLLIKKSLKIFYTKILYINYSLYSREISNFYLYIFNVNKIQ